MFKNISHKKKFFIILVVLSMLSITAYKRSLSGTIDSVKFYMEANNKIKNMENARQELRELEYNLLQIDELIGKKTENPKIIQNEILNFLTENNNNIRLSKIDNIHSYSDEYFKIFSNSITIKGGFNDILKTVYTFEKDFEFARIAALKLYVTRDSRTAKKELFSDILFQNYEKNN